MNDDTDQHPVLSRRSALALLGGAGATHCPSGEGKGVT